MTLLTLDSVPSSPSSRKRRAWVLQVAPNFTGTGYKLRTLGTPTTYTAVHAMGPWEMGPCLAASRKGSGTSRARTPRARQTAPLPISWAQVLVLSATVLLDPLGFPTGVAHTNKDGAGNIVGCYDAGALRITANPVPHLKVVKTPDGDSFSQGGAVSFTIVVSNDGDAGSVATNVQLSDQLPTAGGLNWSGADQSLPARRAASAQPAC